MHPDCRIRGRAPSSAVQGEDTWVVPQSAVVAAWRFRDEGAAPHVIMRTEAPYSIGDGITWHPKERKLAFTALSADLKTAGSWVGSIDLETGRYLTHTREDEAKRWARSPRWSPDGRFLAYVSRRTPVSPSTKDSAKILNVVDMDRGMVSVVPETRLSVWDTWAWDVDGATMFCSYGDEGGIWAVNIVTGQKSLLVADHVMSWPADVSPAGDALSYLNLHDPMVLHIARRGRSGWTSAPVQDSGGSNISGFRLVRSAWVPGGKSLLVLWEAGPGQHQLGRASMTGRMVEQRVLALRAVTGSKAICVAFSDETSYMSVQEIDFVRGKVAAFAGLGHDALKLLAEDSEAPVWELGP